MLYISLYMCLCAYGCMFLKDTYWAGKFWISRCRHFEITIASIKLSSKRSCTSLHLLPLPVRESDCFSTYLSMWTGMDIFIFSNFTRGKYLIVIRVDISFMIRVVVDHLYVRFLIPDWVIFSYGFEKTVF